MQAAVAGAVVATSPKLLCRNQQHALYRVSVDSLVQFRLQRNSLYPSFSSRPNSRHLNVSCRSDDNSSCKEEPSSSSSSSSLSALPFPELWQSKAPRRWLRRAESLLESVSEAAFVKIVLPLAAALYLQVWSPAIAEVVETATSDEDLEFMAGLATVGVLLFLYFIVVPLFVYNYLRLRWYKRNALETYFQFLLVFIFFPGMLLLAPFINFRMLPKEGTKPP